MRFLPEFRRKLRRYDALFLVAAAAMVMLYVATANGGFPLDDSWIHQVYGRNLGLNGQWAFVLGTPSAASTSPLYTVLLAIGYRLGVDYKLWTHFLGTLALAAAAMIGCRLAIRLTRRTSVGVAAGMALIFTWHLNWAAASGMETMLFGAFVLGLIALAWGQTPSDAKNRVPTQGNVSVGTAFLPSVSPEPLLRGGLFGLAAGLTTLTRPDGILLVGLIGLVILVVRPGGWRAVILWGAGAAVVFAVVMTPYLALNLQVTGGLLPNTAAAKQAEYASLLALPFLTRFGSMVAPLLAGGQLLLLPGVGVFAIGLFTRSKSNQSAPPGVQNPRLSKELEIAIATQSTSSEVSSISLASGFKPEAAQRRNLLFSLLLIVWPLAHIALYAARLPAWYQHGRYVIPALPPLIVAGVVGTAWLVELSRKSLAGRVLSRTLAVGAAVSLVYFAVILGPSIYARDVRIIDQEMVATAQWVNGHVPVSDLLAVHDIGALEYFAPRPILDLAGLVSPEVIPVIRDPEALWALLQRRGARYLMAFPDQIPGGDVHDTRLCRVFITNGSESPLAGGQNMAIYALAWDEKC